MTGNYVFSSRDDFCLWWRRKSCGERRKCLLPVFFLSPIFFTLPTTNFIILTTFKSHLQILWIWTNLTICPTGNEYIRTHCITYPVEQAIEVNMDTVPWCWIKQNILSVSVAQSKYIAHHGHNSCSFTVGQSSIVPKLHINRNINTVVGASILLQ